MDRHGCFQGTESGTENPEPEVSAKGFCYDGPVWQAEGRENHAGQPIHTGDSHVITGTSKEAFDYYGMNGEGIAKTAKEVLA